MKNIRVRMAKHSEHQAVVRMVITDGIVYVVIPQLKRIKKLLRDDKEVRLVEQLPDQSAGKPADQVGGIRLFPCLKSDLTVIGVTAQTYGKFRKLLEDKEWEVVDDSAIRSKSEAQELRDAINRKRREREHVSPDTVVTCPKCGNEFRVGKQLA